MPARKAKRWLNKIERAIAAARLPQGAPRITAAVYQTGGLTAGSNTVTNELMQVVGLDNLAARYGIRTHVPLPLELIVAAPPDVLLVGEIPAAAGTQAARIVQHRALRKLPSDAEQLFGALHVLRRADDDRTGGGARGSARRSLCNSRSAGLTMTARRWIMPALLTLVVAAHDRLDCRRAHRARLERMVDQDAISRTILLELRLPRALLGVVVGAALGLAGAAMQGYLRNPLADPGTLGVSAMAALGAVLSIFLDIADLHPWILPSAASPARCSAWPHCSCSQA